jgi:hypothetical protein
MCYATKHLREKKKTQNFHFFPPFFIRVVLGFLRTHVSWATYSLFFLFCWAVRFGFGNTK